ncbi:enolase C-terminal domain-like protein [Cohnella nanjingensis]|uniref:Mandelate racemase n=1 Tax=Cohnella nanjingensis TaxID=1387779 RepID=A0A7X0RZY9_9BACL|nr:enolase C-terminal domain-like protein [Cohnella nanjingensis]MBB6675631.1 mandelate racemase [Cohnella nanjingensis]
MAKITGVRCIRTRKNGSWTIVKVLTDQDGLYGIGSASDIYNPEAVVQIVEQLLAPRIVGRDAANIEDLWQTMYTSGYWRNGALLQTAIGGIDMALWDIKGKEAGLPVYQLLGGACRSAVACYGHAGGSDIAQLKEEVHRYLEEGYTVVRAQLGGYGGGGFVPGDQAKLPDNAWQTDAVFDERAYLNAIPEMFEQLRLTFGSGVQFTHDVHEHLSPILAIQLAKRLEPYGLFFLEDALPPEQTGWYRQLRQASTTPQAIGELFANPQEWTPLVTERLIDFIRVRVSKAGGISAGRKIATLCEAFGVRTAWQEGGENDPVNQAAAVHLDMAVWNFGIQEINHFRPEEKAVFPGHIERRGGYLYTSDKPGLGIDIDEAQAASLLGDGWSRTVYHNPYSLDRKADGTLVRP